MFHNYRFLGLAGCVAGLVLALAACSTHNELLSNDEGHIEIDNRHTIRIVVTDQPPAIIDQQGQLHIATQKIATSDTQRTQLRAYYDHVAQMTQIGHDMGRSGAGMAMHTLKDVVSSLFSGHPDRIEEQVNTRVGHLMKQLKPLCDTLAGTYDAQKALANNLAAFRPYAFIQPDDVHTCQDELASETKAHESATTDTDSNSS